MNNPMLTAAKGAQERAYAPYSNFQVGCCIKTPTGNLYTGCNIENVSYSLTLCAEASAIAAMITAGETSISELVVVSSGEQFCTPCGACRQRIQEFASPNTQILMYDAQGQLLSKTMSDLLPFSFTFEK